MLGRYSLSADPCKPARAERKIHMGASIQQLLERSAQAQSEEVGHTLSLSVEEDENDTETDSDGGDLDSSSSDSAGSTSGAGGDTVATGTPSLCLTTTVMALNIGILVGIVGCGRYNFQGCRYPANISLCAIFRVLEQRFGGLY